MSEQETVIERTAAEYAPYADMTAVAGLQADYSQRLTDIEESKGLTAQGKRAEAAAAYLATIEHLDGIKSSVEAGIDTARHTAERRLFGPGAADPQAILAHRDAFERVDRLDTAASAEAALRQARFSGDDSMIRAITARAEGKGWDGVLSRVERAAPGTGDKLKAYRAIPSGSGSAFNVAFGVVAPRQFVSKDGALDMRAIKREAATLS